MSDDNVILVKDPEVIEPSGEYILSFYKDVGV